MAQSSDYPVQLSVDYAEQRNRLTVFFRPILAIPMHIMWAFVALSGFVLGFSVLLTILFRRKYPRWMFDFNLELRRFAARHLAYSGPTIWLSLLLTDAYPSTDERQSVHLDIKYPDDLNRFLPLVKLILAIPHFIVLGILWVLMFWVGLIAWFAILFTGSYPRSLFDFSVGVLRWHFRVDAYWLMLATDEYPPFRLSP